MKSDVSNTSINPFTQPNILPMPEDQIIFD